MYRLQPLVDFCLNKTQNRHVDGAQTKVFWIYWYTIFVGVISLVHDLTIFMQQFLSAINDTSLDFCIKRNVVGNKWWPSNKFIS